MRSSHDILHQHGLWQFPSIAVSHWRRRMGKPVVISTQGMLEPWALANSRLKKRLASALFERVNLANAACIHCSEVEVIGVRAFGLTVPIAIIPNGADLPRPDRPLPRPAWIGEREQLLLFLGRLHPKKGVAELLRAWAKARSHPSLAGWKLAIVGWDDGGHAASLQSLTAELNLQNHVVFPGPLFGENKSAALLHANAFILPSYSEGLPMAVLEAWAHALPVFMTRECNLPEGFEAGAAVEIGVDPDRLADVLIKRLPGADLASMGVKGRALVEARFAWPAIASQLYAVYDWLVNGTDRPAFVHVD